MERNLRQAKESLEMQVAQRTAHLNETVRSLEGVCYTMAHDLRAPLRSLHGYAEILLEDYATVLDEEGKTYAERMVAATTRMEQLIRDLLEFAKLGHIELPVAPLDVIGELGGVMEALAPDIEGKAANITLPKGPAVMVLANPMLFRQVIMNLVANGIKFVENGVKPEIRITTRQQNGRVHICVKDNGIGVPKEHQQRIFGLFQRLHTSEKYPGTGVGLAIVKRGVERLGGQVNVESEAGKGSTFCITLPKAE